MLQRYSTYFKTTYFTGVYDMFMLSSSWSFVAEVVSLDEFANPSFFPCRIRVCDIACSTPKKRRGDYIFFEVYRRIRKCDYPAVWAGSRRRLKIFSYSSPRLSVNSKLPESSIGKGMWMQLVVALAQSCVIYLLFCGCVCFVLMRWQIRLIPSLRNHMCSSIAWSTGFSPVFIW